MKTLISVVAFFLLTACQPKETSVQKYETKYPTFEEQEQAEKMLENLGYDKDDEGKVIEAIHTNNTALLQFYLDSGFHGFIIDPLVEAASIGNLDILQYLVEERGLSVNGSDELGRTPLTAAIQAGHKEIISYLMEKGAEVDWADEEGRTPLIFATARGDNDTVKRLLEKGVDVNRRDYIGNTALVVAAVKGHSHIFKMLLEKGADPHAKNNFNANLVHAAVVGGNAQILRDLMNRKVDVNLRDKTSNTPLAMAVYRFSIPFVDILLQNGAATYKLDQDGDSPLMLAMRGAFEAQDKRDQLAKLLGGSEQEDLPIRIDKDLNTSSLLVMKLLNAGANPNLAGRDKTTPLMLAAMLVNGTIIDELIKAEAEMNAQDTKGWTALHYAAEGGNTWNIDSLIAAGANPHIKNNAGQTPLKIAQKWGLTDAAKTLSKAMNSPRPVQEAQEEK